MRRTVTALALATVLLVAACGGGGGDDASGSTDPSAAADPTDDGGSPPTTDAATGAAWVEIEEAMAAMAPKVGLLAARVGDDGTCEPVHAVEPATARPIGSQFKLIVLGAVADRIADGDLAWDDTLIVGADDQSFGNGEGSLQEVEPGTEVTVEEAATLMISISDNTAADVLIDLVGVEAVEARAAEWVADETANVPFLTTRQMFMLHYLPGLADRYLDTPPDERADFLVDTVDPRPLSDMFVGLTPEPAHVETIEWFATPEDVCRTFAGLHEQAADPALAPLDGILSQQVVGIELDDAHWPTVWYKGGSEPGVLALGWLAVTDDGETHVVEMTATDPDEPLADDVITDLIDLAADAFALLA
ncbi:MAG: serine hydrolase [Acidimicrobiales bacterium]|nr:serine hydrolase [Acidimicrobiales bacterium]